VPFPAGGPTDLMGRLAGQVMSASLGQSVVVENRLGAGGTIGSQDVARASPDGYTLLLGGTNTNAINAAIYKNQLRPDQGFRADRIDCGRFFRACYFPGDTRKNAFGICQLSQSQSR
jgi:hypothetical protein